MALEALKREGTVHELAARFEIHPNMITQWKRQVVERMADVFASKAERSDAVDEARLKDLHAKIGQPALDRLGYISFLTAGEDEVRAWAIRQGTDALNAAGKIHSDIQRGFIRAETISYDDFIAAGSFAAGRDAGTLRLEGKTYIVKDGDIINFRFNV